MSLGITAGQFTNFTFETTPENFISGITQTSDTVVAEPNPTAQNISFNNLNEITQVSGQAFSYDANGNLLSDGARTYVWDADNRLAGIAYASQPGKQTHYTYDGLGRRIEIDEIPGSGGAAVVSKYIWCGASPCQRRDASYSPTRNYFDEGEYRFDAANLALYYGVDQIGSVRRVFSSENDAPAYDYDPWGVPGQTTPFITDFGFAKMMNSASSGLSSTWFREYDPTSGRWITRDPVGVVTSLNLYVRR
ncbi:RHS repeat-associated core domain-containing protein (plasmid) [Rhizobium sp. CB3090]|uniref:RHS repeat domain-containing protein n=1 Tax=Rhizobium sp. CB3090 TaxID=3039156 RepID=UPI0024B20C96|nr:RHS repeat-associated core domain-containing protein [Rhizobium sp. CB3090]WFU13407.1 RHS repeat-associated core domain-containing protein [Rhizobium sp. CB3090]